MEKPPIIQPRAASEARSKHRARTLLAGVACYRDYSVSISCTIRDLSEMGARLRLASATTLPSQFYLISVKEAVAYDAEIAWIKGAEVGVIWRDKISLTDANPKFSHLRRLYSAKR